jgi:hypothetical protein
MLDPSCTLISALNSYEIEIEGENEHTVQLWSLQESVSDILKNYYNVLPHNSEIELKLLRDL